MKKTHIFVTIYCVVMLILGFPALTQMKVSRPNELHTSPVLEIMLMIACGMAALLVAALLVWRIVKFILVKLGKKPDDYFVLTFSAPKSIQHWIWTRSGIYRKEEDRAEIEREKNKQSNETGVVW